MAKKLTFSPCEIIPADDNDGFYPSQFDETIKTALVRQSRITKYVRPAKGFVKETALTFTDDNGEEQSENSRAYTAFVECPVEWSMDQFKRALSSLPVARVRLTRGLRVTSVLSPEQLAQYEHFEQTDPERADVLMTGWINRYLVTDSDGAPTPHSETGLQQYSAATFVMDPSDIDDVDNRMSDAADMGVSAASETTVAAEPVDAGAIRAASAINEPELD